MSWQKGVKNLMTEAEFQYIIERILLNAYDSINECKKNNHQDYYVGHKIANYEVLDIIKNELIARGENLDEYGLNINLEEFLL